MAHLIHVGNSLGVRIPKAIVAQVGFTKDTDLEFKVTKQGLLLTPVKHPREGWSDAFKSAKKGRKEAPLISDEIPNTFDSDEWQW